MTASDKPVAPSSSLSIDLPSYVEGAFDQELYTGTLGRLIEERAAQYGDKPAVVVPWQRFHATYNELNSSSLNAARALLDLNINRKSQIGIFAGNRFEYIHIILASGRIGRHAVVLNTTYTALELCQAVEKSECKAIFVATTIGKRSYKGHIIALSRMTAEGRGALHNIVLLGDGSEILPLALPGVETYVQFLFRAQSIYTTEKMFRLEEASVNADSVLSLQFTSGEQLKRYKDQTSSLRKTTGTTGQPKASMLTHRGLINNGRFNGQAMRLSASDVVCCPPPLFHCFGLVMGFLSCLYHASTFVMPSDDFDVHKVVDSLVDYKCTALLGVPTMFIAILDAVEQRAVRLTKIRTGLAAGSAVSESLMLRIRKELGITGILIAYGMTETSPVTFISSLDDPEHLRSRSLGKAMPHTRAKIIDPATGAILNRGWSGELCTSGYALQKGYYRNQEKTNEVMKRDADGTMWMHTGDECYIDENGYCFITGRLKDIIIRGGENIYPFEIEERLLKHSGVREACVVSISDTRYGESVGAFLSSVSSESRPSISELKEWVRVALGYHKVPEHVFWIGDDGVRSDFPKAGSGKYQKYILSELGGKLARNQSSKAKI